MKQTIMAILFLITGSKGVAQKVDHKAEGFHFNVVGTPPMAAYLKGGSDTIEIMIPLQVHFIKIGNTVYRIIPHDPTIEEVKPDIQIWKGGTFATPYIETTPLRLQIPAN